MPVHLNHNRTTLNSVLFCLSLGNLAWNLKMSQLKLNFESWKTLLLSLVGRINGNSPTFFYTYVYIPINTILHSTSILQETGLNSDPFSLAKQSSTYKKKNTSVN